MTALFLVAQLIVSSAPPLPPAEAVAALRRASLDLDLCRGLFPLDAVPPIIVITRQREEPKSWIPKRPPPPSITFGLPHGWWRPIEGRPHGSITAAGSSKIVLVSAGNSLKAWTR